MSAQFADNNGSSSKNRMSRYTNQYGIETKLDSRNARGLNTTSAAAGNGEEIDLDQSMSIEEIEHWLGSETSEVNKNRPHDYRVPFAVRTKTKDWFFFAESDEDRQIWVHELRNLIVNNAQSTEHYTDNPFE